MGMAPREYRRLTRLERQAFWDVLEEIKQRMKKKGR